MLLVAPATMSSLCRLGRASGIFLEEGVGEGMSMPEQWYPQLCLFFLGLYPSIQFPHSSQMCSMRFRSGFEVVIP